jgi:hypothetical protein
MGKRLNLLASEQAWNEWQQLPSDTKIAESELRKAAAARIECAATNYVAKGSYADFSIALERWNKRVQPLRPENSRTVLISRIVAEVQHLG